MNAPFFAVAFTVGVAFMLGGGYYFVQADSYNAVHSVPLTPTSSASFSYGPGPTPGQHNIAVLATFYPLANNSETSYLYLNVFGEFPSGPSNVAFQFQSSFNATILRSNPGNGDGVGDWKIYPYQSSTPSKGGSTVIYQFNLTASSPEYVRNGDTSFTGASATVSFTGLPFTSEAGIYNIIFPFNGNQPANGPDNNGDFTICPPSNYLLTSSNENYTSGNCNGAHEGYEFTVDQSEQLYATVQDLSIEDAHSLDQTYSLFLLAVGISALVTSMTFLDSRAGRQYADVSVPQGQEGRLGFETDEERRQFRDEVLHGFGRFSLVLGIISIPFGALLVIRYGTLGPVALIVAGFAFIALWVRFGSTQQRPSVYYPALMAGSVEMLVFAAAFSIGVLPLFANLGELAVDAYYALISISIALILAGLADYTINRSQRIVGVALNDMQTQLAETDRERELDWIALEARIHEVAEEIDRKMNEWRKDDEEEWRDP